MNFFELNDFVFDEITGKKASMDSRTGLIQNEAYAAMLRSEQESEDIPPEATEEDLPDFARIGEDDEIIRREADEERNLEQSLGN